MPATLSPFRYIQLARYVVQWWVDAAPGLVRRRKDAQARAVRFLEAPRARRQALAAATLVASDSGGASKRAQQAGREAGVQVLDEPAKNADVSRVQPRPAPRPDPRYPPESTDIYRLMNDERSYVPGVMQAPKEIVVLCHGLYGFSTATPIPLFPSLKLHYWASVLNVLRDRMGAKVVVVGVKGTGSIQERAEQMHHFLRSYLPRGVGVNFVAHSMGGLDCRHLISTIRPKEYTPLSLTTIATPHHGSPFMDWCASNIGVGVGTLKAAAGATSLPFSMKTPLLGGLLPPPAKENADAFSSFTGAMTNYLLNIFDTPAYQCLRTDYLRDHFNPATPDDPNVRYFSAAGRINKLSVLHPLWFPKLVLDSAAEKGYPDIQSMQSDSYEGNDGLVSVASSKWGEFLGVVDGCHHWDLRGEGGLWPNTSALKLTEDGALGLGLEPISIGNGDPSAPDHNCPKSSDDKGPGSRPDSQLDAGQHSRDLAAARAMSPNKTPEKAKDSGSSGFDLAMVGQLVDWVGDLFPGDKKEEQPTRQLADAKKEMERKETRLVSDKFDLRRFYGGLMLKLREEGL